MIDHNHERNKMMAGKLYDQLQRGWIDGNEFTEKFIQDMHQRTKDGRALTEKQQAKLEELFERF